MDLNNPLHAAVAGMVVVIGLVLFVRGTLSAGATAPRGGGSDRWDTLEQAEGEPP